MTETITVNGTDRSGIIQRKNVEWAESAYLGEVAEGHLQIDDAAGTIVVPAYKSVSVVQSASTPSDIFRGFSYAKGIRRGETYTVGAGREYNLTLKDGNDLLSRLVIRTGRYNRPANETVDDRIAWLLDSELSRVGVGDHGNVASSTALLDKANLRGVYPLEVLSTIAKAIDFNFYIRWHSGDSAWELVWRNDNTSTDDTCTLSISNDKADTIGSSTVLAPFQDAELSEDPEHVYSGAWGAHGRGVVYKRDADTAAAFAERDGMTEDSTVRTDTTADRDAYAFLAESATEEQLLPVTVKLTKAQVGLVKAGMRISTRMTNMAPEGWDPARYARILRARVTQPKNTDETYHAALDLSPQEAIAPRSGVGAIVQSAFARGTHFGLTFGFPSAVTPGNHLVALIGSKLGDGDEPPPNTDSALPRFGAGTWTRFNGSTLTRAGLPPTSPNTTNACAAYWKVADSTEQECYFAVNGGVVGVFELSGADPASATVQDEDRTTGTANYTIGTVGSPATGDIVLAIWVLGNRADGGDWSWDYANSYPWQTFEPNPNIVAGWTQDISKWAGGDGMSLDAVLPGSPWVVIAHALGTGAALDATVQPGESAHVFGGLAIVIPA